jgi:DGQHR domain-containing protein
MENTVQATDNIAKMKDFKPKCEKFVNAKTEDRIKVLEKKRIPPSERAKFKKVKEWRYLYFGTADELIIGKVKIEDAIQDPNFFLFNRIHIQYLAHLADKIGEHGKFELLDHLRIPLEETDPDIENENKDVPTIKLSDKKIRKGRTVDLHAFKLNVRRLLMISKVMRYSSLASVIPEQAQDAYQRLLVEKKLEDMRKFIKREKGSVAFPNAITAILSSEVEDTGKGKIRIPTKYGVLEVVDGQHRLLSFADAGLSDDELKEIELFVIGVKFKEIVGEKLHQWAARTFVDINRNQTKVRTDLIYLILYTAMGERSPKSMAARALLELNIRDIRDQIPGQKTSVLRGIFFSNPFEGKTPRGAKRVKIVTVINELSRLFDKKNTTLASKLPEFNGLWKKYDKLVAKGADIIDDYFAKVAAVFSEDWTSRHSLIFSANYMAAFCKLLIHLREQGCADIYKALNNIKTKTIDEMTNQDEAPGPAGELFNKGSQVVPDVKRVSDIYEYLSTRAS